MSTPEKVILPVGEAFELWETPFTPKRLTTSRKTISPPATATTEAPICRLKR